MIAPHTGPFLHERWFVEQTPGNDWSFFLPPLPLALTATMVAVTLAWRWAALRLPSPELAGLRPLGRAGAVGAPDPGRAPRRHPARPRGHGCVRHPLGLARRHRRSLLLLAEAGVGVWLVSGFRVRPAAALTLALGRRSCSPGRLPSWSAPTWPRWPPSWCSRRGGRPRPGRVRPGTAAHRPAGAPPRRRRGAGVAGLLGEVHQPGDGHPHARGVPHARRLRLGRPGRGAGDAVAVAGAVELLFGLLVISGALPQVAVLVAMVPFNATLALFGQTELAGHLPVRRVPRPPGLRLRPETAPHVRWLPSRRGVREYHGDAGRAA